MRTLAIVLSTVQLLTAVGALCGAIIQLESIIGTGPALTIIGLWLAVVTRRFDSWFLVLFGLSAPLVCALGAFLIAAFHWNPNEARSPIVALLTVYALPIIPASVVASFMVWRGNIDSSLPGAQVEWRFSLRSLLLTMTAVCVFAGLGQYVVRMAVPDFPIVFGTFAFLSVALSGVVIWRFAQSTRRK